MNRASQTQIPARWRALARVAWAGYAALILLVFLIALPVRYEQQLQDPYSLIPSLDLLGFTIEFFAVYGTTLDILMAVGFFSIATLTYWRKAADWMVLLVSLTLLSFPIAILPVSTALAEVNPAWNYLVLFLRGLGFLFLGLTLYLFPNGRVVPPAARWVIILWIVYPLLWPFFPGIIPPAAFTDISTSGDGFRLVLIVLLYGSGIIFQVYRYIRVSTQGERQQTKWVVYGMGMSTVIFIVLTFSLVLTPALQGRGPAFTVFLLIAIPLTLLGFLLLPLTIAIAISRERLWDIDVLIRRTIVYGVLTALLVLIYFGTVTLLQNLLSAVSGQQSPVVIVISTLLIAALFNPLRRRIQDLIDRRFYRSKYDAEAALTSFSHSTRDEVDLENLSHALLRVVEETVKPESVSVWLKERAE